MANAESDVRELEEQEKERLKERINEDRKSDGADERNGTPFVAKDDDGGQP